MRIAATIVLATALLSAVSPIPSRAEGWVVHLEGLPDGATELIALADDRLLVTSAEHAVLLDADGLPEWTWRAVAPGRLVGITALPDGFATVVDRDGDIRLSAWDSTRDERWTLTFDPREAVSVLEIHARPGGGVLVLGSRFDPDASDEEIPWLAFVGPDGRVESEFVVDGFNAVFEAAVTAADRAVLGGRVTNDTMEWAGWGLAVIDADGSVVDVRSGRLTTRGGRVSDISTQFGAMAYTTRTHDRQWSWYDATGFRPSPSMALRERDEHHPEWWIYERGVAVLADGRVLTAGGPVRESGVHVRSFDTTLASLDSLVVHGGPLRDFDRRDITPSVVGTSDGGYVLADASGSATLVSRHPPDHLLPSVSCVTFEDGSAWSGETAETDQSTRPVGTRPVVTAVVPGEPWPLEPFPVVPFECDGCQGSDADGDGTPDECDNCPAVPNPEQSDRDRDGFGDPCDECSGDDASGDTDSDGDCDDRDYDDDGDGCWDSEDPAPTTHSPDDDGDRHGEDCDNCPDVANPEQADRDGDGIGNACDETVAEPSAIDLDPMAEPLRVRALRFSSVQLTWQSVDADFYEVRRGSIAALREGRYDDTALPQCTADESQSVYAESNAYFLVLGRVIERASSAGRDSSGIERPRGPDECRPR